MRTGLIHLHSMAGLVIAALWFDRTSQG